MVLSTTEKYGVVCVGDHVRDTFAYREAEIYLVDICLIAA